MHNKELLTKSGFTVIKDIYSTDEIEKIISLINSSDSSKGTFRKSAQLFAIRQFLKEIPEVKEVLFNDKLKSIIHNLIGLDYFITKSIYFDKPQQSNWFVAYHQDLTISVNQKTELEGYGPWTVKHNQFAVQPPLPILEKSFTVRIHLDDTDENNGALKVIGGSHLKGIYRPETINWEKESETVCAIEKGGIMLMKPLLLHSSGRTTNNNQRRVIHLELCNCELSEGISWAEKMELQLP